MYVIVACNDTNLLSEINFSSNFTKIVKGKG